MPCHLWDLSSSTRAWTQATTVKAWKPNHEATREFPKPYFFKKWGSQYPQGKNSFCNVFLLTSVSSSQVGIPELCMSWQKSPFYSTFTASLTLSPLRSLCPLSMFSQLSLESRIPQPCLISWSLKFLQSAYHRFKLYFTPLPKFWNPFTTELKIKCLQNHLLLNLFSEHFLHLSALSVIWLSFDGSVSPQPSWM